MNQRQSMDHPEIAIILPTFNERENIPLILSKIMETLKGENYEIIVVDDDSPDKTWEFVKNYIGENRERIRLIRRLNKTGLSSAIVEGFASANSDYVVVMDADLQHDPSVLRQFLLTFREGYHIIIGSRKIDGGGIEEWSVLRRIISWVATHLAKFALKRNITDPMSGLFGMKLDLFESIYNKIDPRGFKLLFEILAITQYEDLRIKEIGYSFSSRKFGKSKLSTLVVTDYFVALYNVWLNRYIPLRFVKYAIIGLSGVVVNETSIFTSHTLFNISNEYSLLAGIEFSVMTNYFLNNFWTFRDFRHRGIRLLTGLISFHFISLVGALINFSTAFIISQKSDLNIYLASLCGIMISTIWNYRINYQITWKKEL